MDEQEQKVWDKLGDIFSEERDRFLEAVDKRLDSSFFDGAEKPLRAVVYAYMLEDLAERLRWNMNLPSLGDEEEAGKS